mmetsp:Transcript_15045/g.25078  ORF Transcript_15045/g.25078 Transcript_15045/m.25078 type:complete len:307 (+) Transcript_15045:63-983(+)
MSKKDLIWFVLTGRHILQCSPFDCFEQEKHVHSHRPSLCKCATACSSSEPSIAYDFLFRISIFWYPSFCILDCLKIPPSFVSYLQQNKGHLEEGISGDPVVVDHAADGQHGEAAILELSKGHAVLLLLGLADGQAHGVEPDVAGDAVGIGEHGLHGDVALVGPELHDAAPEDDLEHGGRADDGGGEVGVVDVGVARDGDKLLLPKTEAGEHGGAGVLDLGLAEPLHVEVVGEAEGVEADVADVSLGVLGLGEEGDGLGHGVDGGDGPGAGLGGGKGRGRGKEGEGGNSLHYLLGYKGISTSKQGNE